MHSVVKPGFLIIVSITSENVQTTSSSPSSGTVEGAKRERAWKSPHVSPFLAWVDFHARSRFAPSTIPEEKWETTGSLTNNNFRCCCVISIDICKTINNHRSSGFRSNHWSFIATVLFRMVRNCRTTLIRQLQRLTVKIKNWQ